MEMYKNEITGVILHNQSQNSATFQEKVQFKMKTYTYGTLSSTHETRKQINQQRLGAIEHFQSNTMPKTNSKSTQKNDTY